MFAATICRVSDPANSSDKGHFSELPHRPFQPYVARRRKAGACARQPGSRERRRDPALSATEWRNLNIPRTPHSSYSQITSCIFFLTNFIGRIWRTVSQSCPRARIHDDKQCGAMLQNRRPEERLPAREGLRTEDLEGFDGFCSGCMCRHSWPVIAQADGRSAGGGARKWIRLRYRTSERNNTFTTCAAGLGPPSSCCTVFRKTGTHITA